MQPLQIIPFRASHIELISPVVDDDMRQLALVGQNSGHAFTACMLGRPIGAAGVALQMCGRGQAWAIFSPLVRNKPVSLFRAVKRGLEEIITETHVKKIYAVVDQDDEAAKRFMTHLGFHMKQCLFEREPNGIPSTNL